MALIPARLPAATALLAGVLALHAFLLEDSYGYWYAQTFFTYREYFGFSLMTGLYLALFYIQRTRIRLVYPRVTGYLGLTLLVAVATSLIYSLLSGVMFRGAGTGLLEIRVVLVGILLYFVLAYYFERHSTEQIVRIFLRFALLSAVFHLVIFATGAPILFTAVHEYGRSTAFEGGFLLSWCLGFCFCLAEALLNRCLLRNLFYCVIFFVVVALSYRRFFVLILLAGIAVVFFALPARSLGAAVKRRTILTLVSTLLLLVVAWRRPDLVERMDPRAFLDTESEAYARSYSSNVGHISDIQTGWELLRDHYILGIGLGVHFGGRDNAPIVGSMLHSQHLHTWLRTGVLGFTALVMFYGIMWWRARIILARDTEVFARSFALMVLGVTIPHFFVTFIGPPFYLQQKGLFYFVFMFVALEQLQRTTRSVRMEQSTPQL